LRIGEIKRFVRVGAQRLVGGFGWELRKKVEGAYQSETSKCRARLSQYCQGCGVDLGPGGDPIHESAVRIDLANPYSAAGRMPVQLAGDASRLYWFNDGVLDFVFSSHLLEDFTDTKAVLVEWLRVLKPGGNLVIFCPDEQIYRKHCRMTGQTYNTNHKIDTFALSYVKPILSDIGTTRTIHETPLVDVYSWEIVAQKI
jgi:SAM-dependent methyltransferase